MIRRRRNEGRGQRIKSKVPDSAHPVMIIGGAGFIGSNLANRLLMEGEPVLIFDNLSRSGSRQNILWLTERFGDQVQVELGDILDAGKLAGPVGRAKVIYHFAAQVAVTTSIKDPLCDFESNLHGTLLLLEVMRCVKKAPPLVFTSTNKVYGPLDDIRLRRNGSRYEPVDISVCTAGIREDRPLKFHSPYGCSKGAADQYVLDYSRIYGLKTVVFRMSCIYGPRQFGTEDQGWVAHFLIQALRGQPITLYGDGMQVRDVLYIDDLVDAFMLVREHIENLTGEAFNIGGGPQNTISLVELIRLIGDIHGDIPAVRFMGFRPADQLYYVSDFRKFKSITGWVPRTGIQNGVRRLYEWLADNHPEVLSLHHKKVNIQ